MRVNSNLPIVASDSKIAISFQLSFTDGEIIDEASASEPLIFSIGDGTLLPNLEELLIGLELGTQGKFTLAPESAFGYKQPENIQTMSKHDFPQGFELSEGLVIGFDTPTGDEIPGTILSIKEDAIEIDFNHPLAGATLLFTAKIEQIFE